VDSIKNITKKSLAIVVPELLPVPPVKGGAVEHWVHEVSKRLNQDKYDITIVSRPANTVGVFGIAYIEIVWTKAEKLFHRLKEKTTWRNPLRFLAKIQNVASYGSRMAKLVRNFDLVIIHNEPNLLLFMKKKSNQKIILHMHNEHLGIKLLKPFYRHALKKVDSVICVSDYIRHCAIKHFPEYAQKFTVVFNATDPEIFKPYGNETKIKLKNIIDFETDKTYLLYVGRLAEVKGVHVLIEAFQHINKCLPSTRLVIVGSSFFGGAVKTAYEQSLVDLAKPVSQAIIFTGFIPHEKLKYLYSAIDLVVLPSVWQDPCPLVVLEAMASGTCLVATNVGGVPEVLKDGLNGLLVEPGDVDGLNQAVCEILANPIKKAEIEKAARDQIVANYSWNRLVKELEIIL
jgi:spore coat protein SA